MHLAAGTSLLCLFFSIASPSRADPSASIDSEIQDLSGFSRASAQRERPTERILRMAPSAESFSRHLLYLTEEPHQTGTSRNMELAEYVRDRFVGYGPEEVHFHDTPA